MDDLGGRIGLYPRYAGGTRALLLLPLQLIGVEEANATHESEVLVS